MGEQIKNKYEQSLHDDVTQLYNRKHLLQRLRENMARCDRRKEKFSLILWDIDGFVNFNNQYGQNHGDELLKKVAASIRGTLREYDEAFRCGPDEFSAVLYPADEKITKEVTRRVSQTVASSLFDEDQEYAQHKFTLASGVVFYPGDGQLPEALLHAAGQALYKSRLRKS